ncbi:MAG: hypothetical protein AUJ47_13075 [Candidatus Marinimicrobia bacterium CG1_02_48_14]|nr:MAG: hypothetical protein AUJ47_13075 [Candidatus Marinimicrobia bacterium CG1_02_48_14]
MRKFCHLLLMICCLVLVRPVSALLLMDTHGYMNILGHVSGFEKTNSMNPGYRFEFLALTDIYQFNALYCGLLLGNRTMIMSPKAGGEFRLDQIKYTLSPVLRYEFKQWMVQTSYHHEAFRRISAPNLTGPVWLNSLQLSAGTKGSYYLYLREEYQRASNRFISDVDANLTVSYFLHGKESIWVAKNHNYAYQMNSRVRYHIATFYEWAYWTSAEFSVWQLQDQTYEDRLALRFNIFRKGLGKFVGFYYSYTVKDSYTLDNESHLGALGVQIFF